MRFLDIENLKTYYYTREGIVKAVDNISLYVNKGETLGIVGESGCGKTTLGLSIMRILPKEGRIVGGKIVIDNLDIVKLDKRKMRNIRGNIISMVFQGAMNSLNPVIKIGEQVAEPLFIHGNYSKDKAYRRVRELLSMVGLPENSFNRYPHELSGGQKQRAVIAMALITEPKLLIADEPTTALDVIIQRKIISLLTKLKNKMNLTMILISHDFPLVAEIADRIAIMYGGKIAEFGFKEDILNNPLHPYTKGLINSVPKFGVKKEIVGIPGDPISLLNPPKGCRFYKRCSVKSEKCLYYKYNPVEIEKEHIVYCTLYRD